MVKQHMSIRMAADDKRLLDAVVYVTGNQQIDVLVSGLHLYMESLDAEQQEKIKQAIEIRK